MPDNLYDQIIPNIWPPNSPALSLLEYCVVEKGVKEHTHNLKDSFKGTIVWVMSDMKKEQLMRACNRFRPRIGAFIYTSRGFIEKINNS